ncbi:hypothetical protein AB1Y20_019431 [Prymnesium parvum]|uniref:Uncharacterized protein n=1 Tax=Prymnesium parvum TaxID=97485 RepID=A0AB34JSD5_PRYPA
MIRRRAASSKLELRVTAVHLIGEAKSNVSKISVELDLPGDIFYKSPAQKMKYGSAKFSPTFIQIYSLDTKKELREALIQALRTATEDDSEVILRVNDVSHKQIRPIGIATFRLEQALAIGADHNGQLPVLNTEGAEVGSVTCSINCIAALRELQDDIKADAARLWAEGSSEDGQLIVSVSSLRLASAKGRLSAVQLRILVPGVASAERVSEKIVLIHSAADGKYSTDITAKFGASLGTELRAHMRERLTAQDGGPLEVRFLLESADKKTNGTVIAEAEVSLLEMFDYGEDVLDQRVTFFASDKAGKGNAHVGSLTCSIRAIDLLKKISETTEDTPVIEESKPLRGEKVKRRLFGQRVSKEPADAREAPPGEVTIKLSQLQLNDAATFIKKSGAKIVKVVVAVDVLGNDRIPLRSSIAPLGRGNSTTLVFEKSYSARKESSLYANFVKALESTELEDSEINFIVLGLDQTGEEYELGVGRLSLEKILYEAKDFDGEIKARAPKP